MFPDMAMTDKSSVYNPTSFEPKKKNINPKNTENISANLLV